MGWLHGRGGPKRGLEGLVRFFFFFLGKEEYLVGKKIMSKQKDTLHPSRISTQNSRGAGIKAENAGFQAWKNWACA